MQVFLIKSSSGTTLLEIIISFSILSMILCTMGGMFFQEARHLETSNMSYQALGSVRSFVAEIQADANIKDDMIQSKGISSIYNKYHGKSFNAPNFSQATISVNCYGDEASVPSALGGPQDLNFDGDASDNLSGDQVSFDLRLIPMQITLSYKTEKDEITMTLYRLIGKTVD